MNIEAGRVNRNTPSFISASTPRSKRTLTSGWAMKTTSSSHQVPRVRPAAM